MNTPAATATAEQAPDGLKSQLIGLIRVKSDRERLRVMLESCTCQAPPLTCYCPPVYSHPKGQDWAGHLPADNFEQ